MGAVYQAARATDTVGHNYGMVGMLVGAAFGVALIVGGVLTGGTLFLVAAVAVAALSGAALAHGIQTIKGSGNPTTGVLGFGSPNVRINGLGAGAGNGGLCRADLQRIIRDYSLSATADAADSRRQSND